MCYGRLALDVLPEALESLPAASTKQARALVITPGQLRARLARSGVALRPHNEAKPPDNLLVRAGPGRRTRSGGIAGGGSA